MSFRYKSISSSTTVPSIPSPFNDIPVISVLKHDMLELIIYSMQCTERLGDKYGDFELLLYLKLVALDNAYKKACKHTPLKRGMNF